MNNEQARLYERIEAHPLDHPNAQYPFSARLASENGWSAEYTGRVIAEYKKFVFLSVAAGHSVSPSEAVDRAWHLHLTYTHEYWDLFCAEVLKVPLHHQPTNGGAQEKEKYADWYRQTWSSYCQLFGQEPPQDIWPEPSVRFPAYSRIRGALVGLALITILLLVNLVVSVGARLLCRWIRGPVPPPPPPPEPKPLSPEDASLLLWFAVGFGVTCIVAAVLRWHWRRPSGEPEPEALELDPYEAAYLAGGAEAVRCAAVAALVGDGLLTVAQNEEKLERHPAVGDLAGRHPVERAVWEAVDPEKGASLEVLQRDAEIPEELSQRLRSNGLLLSEATARLGRLLPLGIALLAPLLGLARMLGIPSGKPTAVLILPCLIATWLAFGLFNRCLHRSRRGDKALALLKTRHTDLEGKFSRPDAPVNSGELARAVGLFGIAILAGGPLAALYALVKPHVDTSGVIWVWRDEDESDAGDGGGCGGCGCG